MKEDQTMTSQESLTLIAQMINKARFNFSKGSFYFILWGVLLLSAAVFEHIAYNVMHWEYASMGWPVVGILGGILSAVYGAQQRKSEPAAYLDRVYSSIWMVFFVTLALVVIALVSKGIYPGSFILIITGFPTFLTGYILKFDPLKWGGIGFWALGLLSLYMFEEYRSLIFGFAMVQGYLIPGFLMKNKLS